MFDYSTSVSAPASRYDEGAPAITTEIVEAGTDVDLIDTNPVAALAGNFQLVAHPLALGETNYTEQEARQVTEDIKVKILHTAEAQYDFVQATQKAFDGHIWIPLGYPAGIKGWIQYCKDNFTSEKIRVTGQQRTDLITGFDPNKISNRGIAALLGVDEKTVRNAKAKAGIAPAAGRVRDAAGKRQHVDTGSMSSEERRRKIVELAEEGNKQTDIAEMLDVSQSTVSDTLRKDKMRRLSEGLEPAVVDEDDFDTADDDRPLNLDMGNRDADLRTYIDAFGKTLEQADDGLAYLDELLEDDTWKPGDATVDEIIARNFDRIISLIDNTGKMLRLLNVDADLVFSDLSDGGNYDLFLQSAEALGTVCEEVIN